MKKISTCKQDGNSVRVYDERGSLMVSRMGILVGYTTDTVSIKQGSRVCVYDTRGSLKFSK